MYMGIRKKKNKTVFFFNLIDCTVADFVSHDEDDTGVYDNVGNDIEIF